MWLGCYNTTSHWYLSLVSLDELKSCFGGLGGCYRFVYQTLCAVCAVGRQLDISSLGASLHCIAQIPPFFLPTRPCFQHGCRKTSPHLAVYVAQEQTQPHTSARRGLESTVSFDCRVTVKLKYLFPTTTRRIFSQKRDNTKTDAEWRLPGAREPE